MPRLAEIYNDAVRTTVATFDTKPRSVGDQLTWWRHHDERHPVRVAVRKEALLGWSSLSPWSERPAYAATAEDSVYVDSEARGKGIGRALLADLIDQARAWRYHTLLARVAGGNPVSLRLHTSAGFREVGVMREVGFKFERWVDVHLLQRMIEAPESSGPSDTNSD
jgi:L-amino acid N-acyltransferase YncA